MVTGRGLAGVVRLRYPRWVLWGACILLIVANVINIAADLGGMGDATQMLTGVNSLFWTPIYAVFCYRIPVLVVLSTDCARIFKWITLVLLAYVITAFFAHVDWRASAWSNVSARLGLVSRIHGSFGRHSWDDHLSLFVFLAGLARSGRRTFPGPNAFATRRVQQMRNSSAHSRVGRTVLTGMFASNFIMFFIILTTAATLHAHGLMKDRYRQARAAEALRPS